MAQFVDLDLAYKLAEVIVLGGGVVLAIVRSGRLIQRFEGIAERQTAEITDLKMDVRELSKLVIELTELNGHLNLLEERQLLSGKRLDEYQSLMSERLNELSARFNRYVDDQFDRVQDARRGS